MSRTLMTALVLVPALTLAPAAVADAAQSQQRTPSCKRAKSRTVAQNGHVRLFTRRDPNGLPGENDLFGCWKRTGRVRLLASAYDDEYVSYARFGLVRLRGRFAAFHSESYDISCKAACPPDYEPRRRFVTVADVRTGRERAVRVAARPAGNRLLLDAGGAIAWPVWLPANQVEVRVLDAAGERAVDSGAIHPESLRLTSGGRLRWVRDGVARSLQLTRAST